ncbi:MAG: NAD(+)/NADH kinase [Fusobacteriaceae bacterium]
MKKKCCIFANTGKELAIAFEKNLHEHLKKRDIEIIPTSNIMEADFAVVIGGDGTLLKASKTIIKNQKIHVIAVNAGSLGFLAEIKIANALEVIDRYLSGVFEVITRYCLEVTIKGKTYDALNEVVISKGGVLTKMVRVSIFTENEYINTYRADGVIISTPTGSTAYSLSVGGPIVSPEIKAIIITPIAPHNLTARTVVIDGSEKLAVKIEDENRTGYAVIDGENSAQIKKEDEIFIKYSGKSLKLVLPEGKNYYEILRETLKWGDNLC